MYRPRPKVTLPEVRALQHQFQEWRATKHPGDRIPRRLWNAAARLCRAHPLHRVAQWLRVNSASLRDHAERPPRPHAAPSPPAFLQATVPAGFLLGAPAVEYTLEVEHPATPTLRIRVRGAGVSEIAALAQALLPRPAVR